MVIPSCIQLTSFEVDSFSHENYFGYPRLDCTYNDGDCEFPTNRFLVRAKDQKYYICDSSLNIIVSESDTIIGISRNCWSNFDVPCSTPDRRGGNKIMYQSVSNNKTILYDYNGNLVSPKSYEGVITQDYYYESVFFVVRNTYTKYDSGFWGNSYGLIDTLGNQVIPVGNYYVQQFDDSLWIKMDPLNSILINVKQNKEVLNFDTKQVLQEIYNGNGLILFSQKDKFGLYHRAFGIVVAPEYDEISYLGDQQYALYNKQSIRYKRKRGYKLWKVPEKIIENTPNMH